MKFSVVDSAEGRTREVRPGGNPDIVLVRLRSRLARLAHERLDLAPSTPFGCVLSGEELAADLAYRRAHNAARDDEAQFIRSLVRELELLATTHGLRELRDAIPTVTEAVSVAHGGTE